MHTGGTRQNPRTDSQVEIELMAVLTEAALQQGRSLQSIKVMQLEGAGLSGNALYRAVVEWSDDTTSDRAIWIVKRWQAAGRWAHLTAHRLPTEVRCWQQGLFQRLPPGVRAPFVYAREDDARGAAWIVMEDVSGPLTHFSRQHRAPLPRVRCHLHVILDRLAALHAHWEGHEQIAQMQRWDWLRPLDDVLWQQAGAYARALGEPSGQSVASVDEDPQLAAQLAAFLAWLPDRQKAFWRRLLIDRTSLESAVADLPLHLIHGDTDDRNIGIHFEDNGTDGQLILIDWEWSGLAPLGFDAAKILHQAILAVDPDEEGGNDAYLALVDEMAGFYYGRYRVHGGRRTGYEQWRRSFVVGMVKEHVAPLAAIVGGLCLAADAGLETVSQSLTEVRIADALDWAERSFAYVTREAETWLDL